MDADRAADPADLNEQVDELGARGQQLGELVDDDEQARHRRDVGPVGARGLVLLAVLDVLVLEKRVRRAEHLHPALHLAGDGVLHAVDQCELALEVRDDRGHMRQVVEPGERRAALEVDQYVVELFRAVRHGQAEHERAEELGLAGAGGADAQAVRTHAAHRGLLDVQLDGMAVLGRADGDTKALVERTRSPRLPYVERERVAHAEHRRVVLGRLDDELGGVIVVAAGEDRHAVRAQLAGEHLGVDHRYEIGLAERCGRDLAGLYAPVQRHLVRRDVEHGDPLLDPAWPLPLAGDVDRARRRRRRREHVGADPVHAVDHDDHVDRVAPGDALAAVGHLRQLERGPGEEPYGTGAVRTCRVLYVRQPLDPVPVLGVLRRRHDHQPHLARRVPGHDLGDHRVREPSRGVEIARSSVGWCA